ncbi:hypothetical protein [Pseudonocardia spinosispora]|uniref:hypothetical protein n=1 Tax=Pseudonocardia spinosispora TaxID=103441 RepID=UPI0004128875|nr:hypothetical protein [Pseudonocardia spinosispora]
MFQHGPTTSRTASAISELRLDAWRPVASARQPSTSEQLGSLDAILGDFAPRQLTPVAAMVPAQRTTPDSY